MGQNKIWMCFLMLCQLNITGQALTSICSRQLKRLTNNPNYTPVMRFNNEILIYLDSDSRMNNRKQLETPALKSLDNFRVQDDGKAD